MVKFLETTQVTADLTELIKKSQEKLWLISPYIQMNNQLRGHIGNCDARNVDIKVIFRSPADVKPDDLNFLKSLRRKNLYECADLHAKCYLNENTAIVTSMNLYDYSQTHNREIGIRVDRDVSEDKDLYDEIYQEMLSIMGFSKPFQYEIKRVEIEPTVIKRSSSMNQYPKQPPVLTKETMMGSLKKAFVESVKDVLSPTEEGGYCIRCGERIEVDPDRPLCPKCYKIWAKYSDESYPENYCHICGKESKQSYEKPLCRACYKKANS
jgi:hypothetical protein